MKTTTTKDSTEGGIKTLQLSTKVDLLCERLGVITKTITEQIELACQVAMEHGIGSEQHQARNQTVSTYRQYQKELIEQLIEIVQEEWGEQRR